MDLAFIPPNSMHTWINDGTVNLLLPWQLRSLKADFIRSVVNERYTILDNGAAEGTAVSWNQLALLVQEWGLHEVVIPDRLGDCDWTIENARQAKQLVQPLREQGVKIAAVVQGQTLAEVMKCVYAFAGWDHIDVICLPRILNKQFMPSSRYRLAESLAKDELTRDIPIHCLGSYYPHPQEMRALKDLPNVRSMDTSLPFVYGFAERYVKYGYPRKMDLQRVEGYFEYKPTPRQKEVSSANVNQCLDWIQAPRS
jgi:hypothetical protein